MNKDKTLTNILNDLGLKTKDNLKNKKKGKNTKPIFDSLSLSNPKATWNNNEFILYVDGGRVLTYNEIFSILQYRKYEIFKYKKICKNTVKRAINHSTNKTKLPFFNSPTKLTLIRSGTKEIDRDGLSIVFKYFTDALKIEGIIEDDNPNIIVDIERIQSKGKCFLALKLEKIENWKKPLVPTWEELIKNIK